MRPKAFSKSLFRFAAAIASCAAIVAVAACASPEEAGVNAACSCENCSQGDFQSALNHAAADRQQADALGCGGPYDDYRSCLNAYSTCVNGKYETNHDACGQEKAVLCRCSKEYC